MQNVSAKNKPCAVTIVLYLSKLYTTIASRNTILDIIKQRDTWDSNSPPYNCGETPMTTESLLPWPHDSVSIKEIFALIDRDNFQFLQLCKTSACMLNKLYLSQTYTQQALLRRDLIQIDAVLCLICLQQPKVSPPKTLSLSLNTWI